MVNANEKNKPQKHRIFLWISLFLFVISVVVFISNIIMIYYGIKVDHLNNDPLVANDFGYAILVYAAITVPTLLSELSFIRSVYKVLKYKMRISVRVCYIISSVLSFSFVIFYRLCVCGVIHFTSEYRGDITTEVLACIGPQIVTISFLLESLPVRYDSGNTDEIKQMQQ